MPKPRPLQPREPPLGSPGREELGGVARALPRAERPPERRLRFSTSFGVPAWPLEVNHECPQNI